MKKLWTAPTTIQIVSILNNRQLNADYVESLEESMETHGYLAEYPIEVFESKNIPSIETDQPFLCACGAHRTRAALKADIDAVLVVIYDGGEEDWIERMSLDNFKFDVVKDASIGQAFSQKEKRAACTQLLLLPKYLKMTNTALAEAWNTSEANIRRWRGEVASLIGERSEELQNWGVSPKRLKRLEAVLNSTEREDADGNVVKVRQKAREATEEEKSTFWRSIQKDAGDSWNADDDTFLKQNDFDWDDVCAVIAQKWDVDGDSWDMYTELSMSNLRMLHNWILTADANFTARCKKVADARKQRKAGRDKFYTARQACSEMLRESFCPKDGAYSEGFSTVKDVFTETVQKRWYPTFSLRSDASDFENPLEVLVAIGQFDEIAKAIEEQVDWVEAIKGKINAAEGKKRAKLYENWEKAKQEMLMAFRAYPRDIDLSAFCYAFDSKFYEKAGTCLRLIYKDKPNKNANESTIEYQIDHFNEAADDLKENADWVKRIPEAKPLVENGVGGSDATLASVLGEGKVLFIKVCIFNGNSLSETITFEDDSRTPKAIPLSDLPESLVVQLLEIAKSGKEGQS